MQLVGSLFILARHKYGHLLPVQYFQMEKSSVLPPYILFVWINIVLSFITAALLVVFYLAGKCLDYWDSSGTGDLVEIVSIALIWASWHFLIDGVAIMLLKQGIGMKSFKAGLCLTLLSSLFTFCCIFGSRVTLNILNLPLASAAISGLWNLIMLFFYGSVYLLPDSMFPIFRRPATFKYSLFYTVIRGCGVIASIMTLARVDSDITNNFKFAVETVLFTLLQPIVLYTTFTTDSAYWRGEDEIRTPRSSIRSFGSGRSSRIPNSVLSAGELENIRAPLVGQSWPAKSANAVIKEVNDLYSKQNLLIDYRDLSLRDMSILGVGGSARVYKGSYNAKPVAVKLIYCIELTRELVKEFFSEAKILEMVSGSHPNIVSLRGVCVAPPALGMVLELCDGSLYDEIQQRQGAVSSLSNFLDRAIQCTRSLLYLHNRSPPLCHCDVKSLNFLLKGNFVKLADMGMTKAFEDRQRSLSRDASQYGALQGSPSRMVSYDQYGRQSTSYVGTAQWAAPELLENDGAIPTTAADVYSLGVVLWEIYTGRSPYEHIRFPSQVIEFVQRGGRPEIPDGMDPRVEQILKATWTSSPIERITCEEIMQLLFQMLEREDEKYKVIKTDVLVAIADPKNGLVRDRYHNTFSYRRCFIGSEAVKFVAEKFSKFFKSKQGVLDVLNDIMSDGVFKHVLDQHNTLRDEYLFYRFEEDAL